MKLFIFDNGLENKSGHHFAYATALYNEWTRRGFEAVIITNKKFDSDLRGKYNIIPIFSHYIRKGSSSIKIPSRLNKILHLKGLINFIFENKSYFKDLKSIKNNFSSDDIVLIHTIDPTFLFGVYCWYRSLPKNRTPYLVLLFRFGNIIYSRQKKRRPSYYFYKLFLSLINQLPKKNKVIIVTDSDDLTKEYSDMSKTEIHTLPVLSAYASEQKHYNGNNNHGKAILMYLGDASDDKGYYLLPEAINFALQTKEEDIDKFVIQSNIVPGRPADKTLKAKKELSEFKNKVVLVNKALSPEEYLDLMSTADAILIPCRATTKDGYYARTSGIFTDALALGKPVIITENTWLERQAEKYEAGRIIIKENDSASLGKAMVEFLNNREKLKAKSAASAIKWEKYHNVKNYFDILINLIEKARQTQIK